MKKKLIHLQLLSILSGVQRFSLHLLDGLPPDEYEIYVAGQAGGELEQEVKKRGWSYLPISSLKHPISLYDILSLWQLFHLFKAHRFDIVHTNSSKPGLLGRLAARLAGIPLIIHSVHGTSFQEHHGPLQKAFFMMMEKLGNALGDLTVFVNNSDRLRCIELGLVKPEKALSILNALPPAQWQAAARSAPSSKDQITIGSTLRFSEQKNVIALISAACKACIKEPALRFIILGDGPHLALCRSIVASYRLSARILLPGWDSEVKPWLQHFDVFILYSRWEAMPFSIIEAMQSGLPVIGSEIPSICEIVDEQSGWIVPLDDEPKLIETLCSLAQDPQAISAKADYTQKHIRRLCDYQFMVDSYRKLYEGEL